ncbi:hypothetical protein PUN28_010028 [Cardiocondyla obscurior]|uniref:Uncharacterized protein n=2 Tax=Cardiocondyla obscurior TaxID=286306 RepID=A0AAW2FNJ6_9HYME
MFATNSVENTYKEPLPGEEIVISGIAGKFPNSDNVEELKNNLMNKVDVISDDDRRWKLDHPDIPQRTGKIYGVRKFDAQFFHIPCYEAHMMDPMSRLLLERAYEAVIDAGINPKQLRGSRTGVFVGTCCSESEVNWFFDKPKETHFGLAYYKNMQANRISYYLGLTGPSHCLDSACNSSLVALECAYQSLINDRCDNALVGGSQLCLHPYMSLQFSRLGILSPDGRSKVFDVNANGYARSEAISVVYLQKAKNAKRIYGTLVYGRSNCDGFKEQGITFPSSKMQSQLLQECYDHCNLSPNNLSYLECHGTGTTVGDPEEISAIETSICKKRTDPLLIGSVKSNLGHSEGGSGLTQVAKLIIAMETGIIPPNLHYTRPQESSKAIIDGKLKVVTEPTPWNGGYAGISSFGFGGVNCHLILKHNPKNKIKNGAPSDNLPRLVTVSGRTEESVKVFLDDIEKHSALNVDIEYINLIHSVYSENILDHLYRGFTIVGSENSECTIKEIENYLETPRPIWFVFSGIGSQWPGMGADLMKFPVFAEAIKKCDAVLQPRGVDIINIVTSKDKTIFDNILHLFVGIAAVQIGLVDLIKSIGIVPNNIIGHSTGELGCAYADECFTAEQTILSAYLKGLAFIETEVIYGLMAVVSLGYNDVKDICPSDIDVACHNSSDSSIISGPADSMKELLAQLQAKQIFVKEVPCSNIPYHSRYVAPVGSKLLSYLKKIIPEPKPRSSKWVSTSVPRNKWSIASAKLSSAEYHTNNLLSPVLFEETARMIPKNAVTIEIAPHGILQEILRQSLGSEVTNIALTQSGYRDNVEVLLQAIGKLYNAGLQPNIASLYPSVEYPVSRGTPMISPSIRWNHSDDWFTVSYKTQTLYTSERIIALSLENEETEYISGHVIDGKNLIPATAYLILVWQTMGMLEGSENMYSELSVVFEDISFIRATHMPKNGDLELRVMVQKDSGRFEVTENDTAVVTGIIRIVTNPVQEKILPEFVPEDDEEEVMNTKDIYKELKLRGYQYSGAFRSLKSATKSGRKGHIGWMGNWAMFLDNMLQILILELDTRKLFVPTKIRKIVIDTKLHQQEIRNLNPKDRQIAVYVNKYLDTIVSGGVEICNVKAMGIPRRLPAGDPVLEEYKFVAHRDGAQVSLKEAISLSIQIALEYYQTIHVNTIELIHDSDNITETKLASPIITEILGDLPLIQAKVYLSAPFNRFNDNLFPNVTAKDINNVSKEENILFAVGVELLSINKKHQLNQILLKLKNDGFILTREKSSKKISTASKYNLDVILEKNTGEETLILLKKKAQLCRKTDIIYINNDEFTWLEKLNSLMNAEDRIDDKMRIILVSEGDLENGLLGFVNCLRKEPGGEVIRSILIQDTEAPKFSLQNPLYSEQLQLDLPINVLRPGKIWGSYRHLLLSSLQPKLVRHAYVTQMAFGDLSSFRWVEGNIRSNDEDQVYVAYAPLNFKDIMLSTGKLILNNVSKFNRFVDCNIGIEYAGVEANGRRVMGIVNQQCISNILLPDKLLYWTVPDTWSLEDAATAPCVYATCCFALYMRGKVKKGEKILIHCGTGGIGQAAIHLALYEGCEVFTTVGTPEKRKFIRETFPSIPEDHIGHSRDTSFEQMILQQTNANNPLGLMAFLKGIDFYGVMVDNLSVTYSGKDYAGDKVVLSNVIREKLKCGAIKPLTRKVFKKDEVETAFRYMAAGKHIGKVIIKIFDEKELLEKKPVLAQPRYYCDSNKTYLILGGLGGFGLELADWLIIRGAKNVVLTSRTGIKNGYQHMKLDRWKSYGVNVLIISGADASNRKDCEFILNSAEKQGSVDAIFNLAVVLKDSICKNQTPESFEESFKAKARTTKMLDELSRSLCPKLQHFVVFSSVSCGRGNAGQTNYGMGNSIMERICERRVADGLPGLAIQWGAIGEVGLVADWQDNNKELVIGGTLQQRISSCLEKLEHFLLQNCPIVSSMVVAEKRVGAYGAANVVEAVANILGKIILELF